tara:strand:- start:112 stop:387 length:276 start_codon:yes stop_codon:yes gene_type:complete
MNDIRNIVREVLSEIVSTEVDRAPGGGPDVQKNQGGYGYYGSQSDAPKQERKNDTHIYFNNVTNSASETEGGDGGDTVEESEELDESDDFV